jgi:hypothetical protein
VWLYTEYRLALEAAADGGVWIAPFRPSGTVTEQPLSSVKMLE